MTTTKDSNGHPLQQGQGAPVEIADETLSTSSRFNDDDDGDLEKGAVIVNGNDYDNDDDSNLPLQALTCLVVIGIILATATAILGRDDTDDAN